MAASVSINLGGLSSNLGSGIAFEIEISECVASTPSIPKRVRQRLEETVESRVRSPASLEDIEVKLKEADSRRQQFHEWLANKARPKPRSSPSHSKQSETLAQRLEAKLSAAEQKRAELLAHEQTRLAKLHELRVAAKTEAQLRAEREREELGSKVESRVQQAETNRLALLEAERQRIAAVHERIAQSILQRTTQEGRDRDRIEALRATILQKISAAEEKRAGLLEAEKSRAQACVLQAREVAKAVLRERELEMRTKKEKLEAKLQRAKRQRAEYLMKRGGCRGSCHNHGHKLHKHGDRLCRKLTRCWRQFRGSRRTTYALAQDYAACAINQEVVMSLPFEQLAAWITSPTTLRGIKPLLARIESRLMLSSAGKSSVGQVEHLLKRLSPPRRKTGGPSCSSMSGKKSSSANNGSAKDNGRSQITATNSKADERELERYPARVFLCAYMILGQPDAVFSSRGEQEAALADAAAKLLPEFEALLSIILDGRSSTPIRPSSPRSENRPGWGCEQPQESPNHFTLPSPQRPFSAQLAAFDVAWCAYLYQFVVWKVKDAQLLEEDLTRMACQLEISMLQKCKVGSDLSHDSKAIRKQVREDQKLLHDRILRLTGTAGASRMDQALSDARSNFNEAMENGTPLPSPFSHPSGASRTPITSPPSPSPFLGSPDDDKKCTESSRSKVVRSLFSSPNTSDKRTDETHLEPGSNFIVTPSTSDGAEPFSSNEKIVNEMLHDQQLQSLITNKLKDSGEPPSTGVESAPPSQVDKMQAQIRSTMENAFWDGVLESLLQTPPEYGRVVVLVGEIRDELENVVPEKWKQELQENMDLELVSQILESGTNDFEYLRHLLDYASGLILKLGAPARDSETKVAYQLLLTRLSAGSSEEKQSTFANALVKGLRFIFEQLQVLKQDINAARLQALAPLLSGPAGVEYMRKAFATRFNLSPVSPIVAMDVTSKLPHTAAWIQEVISSLESQRAEVETAESTLRGSIDFAYRDDTVGSAPIPTMRTGGRVGMGGYSTSTCPVIPSLGGDARPRNVVWKSNDTILRLGILRIVCNLEPATEANLPETLTLNVERLRSCQNEVQRIIVMATGLLVARQGLTGREVSGRELDDVMGAGLEQLDTLLSKPNATINQIGALLAQISSKTSAAEGCQDNAAFSELMTRVLTRSLSPEDPVWARVSAAVGASMRAVLLLGKGMDGLAVAKLALKRIGGSLLTDKVISAADMLGKIASVTCRVHEPWYSSITTTI